MILIISFFLINLFHDYKSSITSIELNPKTKKIEVISRIFTDDLQIALENLSKKKIDLSVFKADSLLNIYLKKHFSIKRKKEFIGYIFLGYKIKDNVTSLYLEFDKVEKLEGLEIVNDILMNEFEAQFNVINFKLNNEFKGDILRVDKKSCIIK